MNRSIAIILATVALTATGIGLTMPVIPELLREVGHTGDLGWRYGAFLALYALMQFVFSPLLGALSDRFGRRPLLLMSLAGATVDYLFMTLAPTLWLLFIGRAIAGVTGAVSAVASAYIADVTPEDQRARRFGQLGAAFGVGFIAGPAIGGLLGGIWTRAPFLAAAVLNLVTEHQSHDRFAQPLRSLALGTRLSIAAAIAWHDHSAGHGRRSRRHDLGCLCRGQVRLGSAHCRHFADLVRPLPRPGPGLSGRASQRKVG